MKKYLPTIQVIIGFFGVLLCFGAVGTVEVEENPDYMIVIIQGLSGLLLLFLSMLIPFTTEKNDD
tara:strand:+ start:1399 stop:1593 length:195 start_codon:yes stop_codon:yes gene_type:complete